MVGRKASSSDFLFGTFIDGFWEFIVADWFWQLKRRKASGSRNLKPVFLSDKLVVLKVKMKNVLLISEGWYPTKALSTPIYLLTLNGC